MLLLLLNRFVLSGIYTFNSTRVLLIYLSVEASRSSLPVMAPSTWTTLVLISFPLLALPCSPAVLYTQQVSVILLLAVCLALIIDCFSSVLSPPLIILSLKQTPQLHLIFFFHRKRSESFDHKLWFCFVSKNSVFVFLYMSNAPMSTALNHGAVKARYMSIIQQDLTPPVNIVLPPWA